MIPHPPRGFSNISFRQQICWFKILSDFHLCKTSPSAGSIGLDRKFPVHFFTSRGLWWVLTLGSARLVLDSSCIRMLASSLIGPCRIKMPFMNRIIAKFSFPKDFNSTISYMGLGHSPHHEALRVAQSPLSDMGVPIGL